MANNVRFSVQRYTVITNGCHVEGVEGVNFIGSATIVRRRDDPDDTGREAE